MNDLDRTRVPGATGNGAELRDMQDAYRRVADELVLSEARRGYDEKLQATTREQLTEARADMLAWRNLAYAFATLFVVAVIFALARSCLPTDGPRDRAVPTPSLAAPR